MHARPDGTETSPTSPAIAARIVGVAESGGIADARALLEALRLDGTPEPAAVEALARALGRTTPDELVRFGRVGRSEPGWWSRWAGPAALVATAPRPVQLLATFHPSGYVREAALVALSDAPEALPYLLLRLNDWVDPIAARARLVVEALVSTAPGDALARALPVVERLRRASRRRLEPTLEALEASLLRPEAREALSRALGPGPRDLRRACVALAGRLPPREAVPILLACTADRDAVVASRATQALAGLVSAEKLRETFAPLLQSRAASVRLLALGALATSSAEDLDGALRRALMDGSAAVRARARDELERRGHGDVSAIYVAALRSGDRSVLATALSGLRECGARQDAALALPFASHRIARVRVAAFRALGKLAPDAHAALLASGLTDPSLHVVRAAGEALRGRAHLVNRARLEALLGPQTRPLVALTVAGLLGELSPACSSSPWKQV